MKRSLIVALIISVTALSFCGSKESATPSDPAAAAQPADKGIGPIKELALSPVSEKLAEEGKQLFDANCTACHGLDKNMTGPALGAVLKSQTPEFVMNMLLNTAEMVQKNETVKKLAAKFRMPMPSMTLTQDQARAILEYLRTTSK